MRLLFTNKYDEWRSLEIIISNPAMTIRQRCAVVEMMAMIMMPGEMWEPDHKENTHTDTHTHWHSLSSRVARGEGGCDRTLADDDGQALMVKN